MNNAWPKLRWETAHILSAEGLREDLEFDAARFLGTELPPYARPEGSLLLELEISAGTNHLLLEARLRGTWRMTCSRCLAEHSIGYDSSIEETFPLSEPILDIRETVRQAALLEIPARSLCCPGCRGLCPVCGKNLNAEPCRCKLETPSPLAALKRFIRPEETPHAEP